MDHIFVAPFACVTLSELAPYGSIFHLSITPYNGPVAEADIANMHPPQHTYNDALAHTHICTKTNKTSSAVSLIVQRVIQHAVL